MPSVEATWASITRSGPKTSPMAYTPDRAGPHMVVHRDPSPGIRLEADSGQADTVRIVAIDRCIPAPGPSFRSLEPCPFLSIRKPGARGRWSRPAPRRSAQLIPPPRLTYSLILRFFISRSSTLEQAASTDGQGQHTVQGLYHDHPGPHGRKDAGKLAADDAAPHDQGWSRGPFRYPGCGCSTESGGHRRERPAPKRAVSRWR